jgi:hypothetical protein
VGNGNEIKSTILVQTVPKLFRLNLHVNLVCHKYIENIYDLDFTKLILNLVAEKHGNSIKSKVLSLSRSAKQLSDYTKKLQIHFVFSIFHWT